MITIKKETLKKALELVKPGLAKSNENSLEQLTSFAFKSGHVVTYNDEISVSHIFDCNVEGAIKADELYKFVSKITDEDINIIVDEKQMVLTCGKSKAGFALEEEIKLPLLYEDLDKNKWYDLPENFKDILQFASICCSKNLSDPKLTCVHVNKKGIIESCDNSRLYYFNFNNSFKFNTFLLPQTSAQILNKYSIVSVSENKGWVHFKTNDNTIISCRTFNDSYVDTTSYIKFDENNGKKIKFPAQLMEVLERAMVFSEEQKSTQNYVDVSLHSRRMKIKSQSETAWFEETLKIEYSDEAIDFTIDANMLKDIMKLTDECLLIGKMLYFYKENWIYITTLRIK